MEEEKAAAYYDELTRKGEGAARFKQGLGFSSASNDAAPSRGSALSSSSSYLSSFVKASSPSKASELQKEAQLASIQNKLAKKRKPGEVQSQSQSSSRVSIDRDKDDRHSSRQSRSRDRHSRHKSRSRSRDNDRRSRRKSQSRDRDRHSRRRSRSRSRSRSRDDHRQRRRHRSISRERDRERVESRRRGRSRSESPKRRRSEKSDSRNGSKVENERIHNVDYAKLIEGYDKMIPAERVKAKMKLQISETVKKDEANMGSGWERFDFDKDAPLDDEEIEAAEDDAVLVKHMGQSFRFSAVEARKEDDLKAAHDKAMFGAPLLPPSPEKDEESIKSTKDETTEGAPVTNLISDQVLTMQQGSWRDRIRKT